MRTPTTVFARSRPAGGVRVASPDQPRENPLLFGHAAAQAQLVDAMRGGRLHHAWLITGPPGVGKATLAYRFARRLLAGPAAGWPWTRPARCSAGSRPAATPTC